MTHPARSAADPPLDLLVVGGGINGAGIARDAAGRGLAVGICDQGDFAGGTSSASTKLIHGGLRYLEQYEFRLVAESLAERETLARIAAHLVRPLRFVLPHVPGLRPVWLLRGGLFLYDRLGALYLRQAQRLPPSAQIDLRREACGEALRGDLKQAFVYSDLAVDDARLVIATLRSAAAHGARVMPRTRLLGARRENGLWQAELSTGTTRLQVAAKALINAAGPWVMDVVRQTTGAAAGAGVVLVKGCHLVLPRLFADDHALLLQNTDGRIVFVIPYRQHFTLIGTTDKRVATLTAAAGVGDEETNYLLDAVNRYLRVPLTAAQVIHRFWGVRPLFDDGSHDPSALSRDYHLAVDNSGGAPCIAVFGGKLTTYRQLAETVLARLPPEYRGSGPWTRGEALPGSAGFVSAADCVDAMSRRYPWLDTATLAALVARHGTEVPTVLGDADSPDALGRRFADGLCEREIEHFVAAEWAQDADDILWRRSKAGLFLSPGEDAEFRRWFAARRN